MSVDPEPDREEPGRGRPVVARTRHELNVALGLAGRDDMSSPHRSVALVPTMGALHAGHAALFDVGRQRAELLVASVFVNPLQFSVGEDLERYPRSFDADVRVCTERGVDIVFAPSVHEVYPAGEPHVSIDPGPMALTLEGAIRPGHFRGVLTVVAKLFGLVGPDVAVFGQKDYQQLVLVRQMVSDLCLPIDVVGAETVRDPAGLALSSRNRYLDPVGRHSAEALSRALRAGADAGAGGGSAVLAAAQQVLAATPEISPDYLELRGLDLAEPPDAGPARLLVAARVGSTRLIDNTAVWLGSRGATST